VYLRQRGHASGKVARGHPGGHGSMLNFPFTTERYSPLPAVSKSRRGAREFTPKSSHLLVCGSTAKQSHELLLVCT
jgi:hypothetical protein